MMSCNYQNIYDLCANKYSYQYTNVIFNGVTCVADSGNLSPVIRTDKDNGNQEIINQYSTSNIDHCDSSNESESISSWDCYQQHRQAGGSIEQPPLETFRLAQDNHIISSYNDALNNGITISINNNNILLDASLDKQTYYRSMVTMYQMLYNEDVDSTMPSFMDKNHISYNLNYNDINNLFQTYFRQVIYYKNLKELLLNRIKNATNIVDIQSVIWDTSIPIADNNQTPVNISASNMTPTCPYLEAPQNIPTPCSDTIIYIMQTQNSLPNGGYLYSCDGNFNRFYMPGAGFLDEFPIDCPSGCTRIQTYDYSCPGPNWPPQWDVWLEFAHCAPA